MNFSAKNHFELESQYPANWLTVRCDWKPHNSHFLQRRVTRTSLWVNDHEICCRGHFDDETWKKIKNLLSIIFFPVHICTPYCVTSSAKQRHKHPYQHNYKVIMRILPRFWTTAIPRDDLNITIWKIKKYHITVVWKHKRNFNPLYLKTFVLNLERNLKPRALATVSVTNEKHIVGHKL